ncbi:MAG: hypothetical protein GYB67_07475 [Chloroflexi bacterium]|nr:hypothetical protein [Chloroflexota bacterium]
MPVEMQWLDDEQTVLHFVFSDPWTVADYRPIHRAALELISTLDYPVHGFYDFRASKSIPANAVTGFMRTGSQNPWRKNAGIFVVISNDRFLKMLARPVSQLFRGFKIYFVDTLDEAWERLARHAENPPKAP